MKKINISVAAVLLAGTMVSTSCIGSYSLFNKYEKWQCNMTSNKYVNGIVGLIIQPFVGGVCLFIDSVVLNTIEFWSGSNPIAANTTTTVKGQDGLLYAVKTLKNGYEVTAPNGTVTMFIHNDATDTWSMEQNGQVKELFRFNADGTLGVIMNNGNVLTVGQDEAGLQQVQRAAMAGSAYYAFNM